MARHNYQFEKRQRDLAKKQKKEEKRQRKLEQGADPESEAQTHERSPGENDASPADPPS